MKKIWPTKPIIMCQLKINIIKGKQNINWAFGEKIPVK